MRHIGDRLFLCTIVLCGSIYALGIYWWFFDELFKVDEILTPTYTSAAPGGEPVDAFFAGDALYLNWHYNLMRRCANTFQRKLVNPETAEVIMMEDHHGLAPNKAGEIRYASRIQLPGHLDPGPWEYHLKGVFECNPLEPQIVRYPPVPFRIVAE